MVRLPTNMIAKIKAIAHQLGPLIARQLSIGMGGSDKPATINAITVISNARAPFAFCAKSNATATVETSNNNTMWRAVVCGLNVVARKMSTAHSRLATALARG